MINSLMKNTGKVAKFLIGLGFVLALLLIGTLRGCFAGDSTNRHDVNNTKAIVDGSIKLQEMENKKQEAIAEKAAIEKSAQAAASVKINESDNNTKIEMQKLEIQGRGILDVNKAEERKMQLELKKIELIEAQKLKNELEVKKLEISAENQAKERKAQAAAAAAAAKARKEKEDIEILKAIAK